MEADMNPLRMVRLLSHMVVYQLTTEKPRNYKGQWNSYWGAVQHTGPHGEVLWDNLPEHAAAEDLQRFLAHIDPNLPMLDLGCGNGRQSRFLAGHFKKVIGVDVAPAAVARAEQESDSEANLEYRWQRHPSGRGKSSAR
jgi:2-polyprenyl-3-methyl-5-hydroxy-6-metoxy-1,4-benzoquinol methylase